MTRQLVLSAAAAARFCFSLSLFFLSPLLLCCRAFAAAIVYAISCLRPRNRAGCVEEAEQEEEVCLGDGFLAISDWRAASCRCLLCFLFELLFIYFWFFGWGGGKQAKEEEVERGKRREEKKKRNGKERKGRNGD